MAAMDMNTLNQYVRLEDHVQFQALAEGTVSINVSHSNLNQTWPEIRMDLHTTIAALKDRLYRHGGTASGFQKLILRRGGEDVRVLSDDSRMLGFYGVQSGDWIHIVDLDPYSFSRDGGLENVDLVKKYEMSEKDYEKRENSLRAYKRKMREKDPNWTFFPENRKQESSQPPATANDVEGIKIGDRCIVAPGDRRGTVQWIGQGKKPVSSREPEPADGVEGLAAGYFVGVALDEPLGKSSGTVKGRVLFDAPPKYACFVKPSAITVGDYPELDPLAELSSDEDEL